jgi:hypothetical protein
MLLSQLSRETVAIGLHPNLFGCTHPIGYRLAFGSQALATMPPTWPRPSPASAKKRILRLVSEIRTPEIAIKVGLSDVRDMPPDRSETHSVYTIASRLFSPFRRVSQKSVRVAAVTAAALNVLRHRSGLFSPGTWHLVRVVKLLRRIRLLPRPRVDLNEALRTAKAEGERRGWPWLEPVHITEGWVVWYFMTNAHYRGANANIWVDSRTGLVRKVGFTPR